MNTEFEINQYQGNPNSKKASKNNKQLRKIDYNIVLGCPRSGTTFLMQCLNSLSNTECVSGHLLPILIPHMVNHSLPPDIDEALSRSIEFSFNDYLESIHVARVPVAHKWLTGHISIYELLAAFQGKRTIERLVYKEPFLAFAPKFIYNALPDCKIVHIYRDGRDVADSLVRTYQVLTDEKLTNLDTAEMPLGRQYDHRYVPWWLEEGKEEEFLASTPYIRAIWMWKEIVSRCHEFFSHPEVIASSRVMLLKYEELVNDPVNYGQSVVEHFGGRMNDRLKRQFKQARASSSGIHKRKNAQEIQMAEKIAKPELELYGYL